MLDYYLNPDFAYKLAMIITDFFIELEKQAIEIGADIILDGEDYGGKNGLFMSVEHFKRFVLPGLRKVIAVAKSYNVPFV
jgi:uroporphyrinogen-III decarboxylase